LDSGREFLEALKAASPQAAIRPAAEGSFISQTELRFGIRFPPDMAAFYRSMNGMDWPTEPDHGWIRIWELESWRRVREEPNLSDGSIYVNLGDAILLADHCDESWWYAADLSGAPGTLAIYLVDGLRPAKFVARNFTAFVNAALADAADIYPDD
jgi:cell wall assembly regulator SMI1